MKSTLLIVGGVIQILITVLHIYIFFGIASASELSADAKITAHIFNAAVTVTVMFFGYVSLMRRQDLLNTSFGKIISGFIAVFYIQRGLVEIFLRGVDAVTLGICLVTTVIYIVALLPSKQEARAA